MELCIIGLNHRTTPLEFREQFSVPADQVPPIPIDNLDPIDNLNA